MQKYNFRYQALKIDLTDTFVNADVFDSERYVGLFSDNSLEELLTLTIAGFWQINPKFKNYNEWLERAESGAYDYIIQAGSKPVFRTSLLLVDPKIANILELVRAYHAGQKRKAGGYDYLEHVLEVGYRLWRRQFPPKVVAAGFGHDLLEDTKCTAAEILEASGAEVLRIIKAVTNDSSLPWEEKKEKYIKTVKEGGKSAIAVCITDKICNLVSLLDQYDKEGPSVWQHFNRGKAEKLWFEKAVYKMAKANWQHQMLNEYKQLIEKLKKTKSQ